MKNLFKLGLASLLLSVFVLSGCHKDLKDDIDDLKDRVTTIEGTLKTLKESVDGLKVVTNVSVVGNVLKIQWNDGSSTDIQGVVNEAFPDPEVVNIVSSFDNSDPYFVEVVINNSNAANASKTYFRFPKAGMERPSAITVLTDVAAAKVGETSHVIFSVNPPDFTPTKENITLVQPFPTRAINVNGVEYPVTVTDLKKLADAGTDIIPAGYTPQEGEWVVFFTLDALIETGTTDEPVKLGIKYPKNASTNFLGAWNETPPAKPETGWEMSTIASNNTFTFGNEQVDMAGTGQIVLNPAYTADATNPMKINSDQTGTVNISVMDKTDATKAWADSYDAIDLTNSGITVTAVTGTRGNTPFTFDDETAAKALLSFKTPASEWAAPTVEGAFKSVAFTTENNAAWDAVTINTGSSGQPIENGDVLTFTVTVSLQPVDAGGNTTPITESFNIVVTKVTNYVEMTPNGQFVNVADRVIARNVTSGNALYEAFEKAGVIPTEMANATRTAATIEYTSDGTTYTAYTGTDVVVGDVTAGAFDVTVKPAAAIGSYKITYTYTLGDRTITIVDTIEVAMPTLTVKLPATAVYSGVAIPVIGGTGNITAVEAIVDLKGESVDLNKIFDAANLNITTDAGYVYQYENGNVGPLTLSVNPVTVPADPTNIGKAQKLGVTAKLTSGQVVPVTVVKNDDSSIGWTAGDFYINVMPNRLDLTLSATTETVNFYTIKATPFNMSDLITAASFEANPLKDTQLPTNIIASVEAADQAPYTIFDNILKDPRFAEGEGSFKFKLGVPQATAGTIPAGITSFITANIATIEHPANPDAAGDFKGAWTEKYIAIGAADILVTIPSGLTVTQTVTIVGVDPFGGEYDLKTVTFTIETVQP